MKSNYEIKVYNEEGELQEDSSFERYNVTENYVKESFDFWHGHRQGWTYEIKEIPAATDKKQVQA